VYDREKRRGEEEKRVEIEGWVKERGRVTVVNRVTGSKERSEQSMERSKQRRRDESIVLPYLEVPHEILTPLKHVQHSRPPALPSPDLLNREIHLVCVCVCVSVHAEKRVCE
jgi:hypothetical protein